MLKKFLIIAGLIASTSAFAQAEKFSGFSIGLNTGIESNTTYFQDAVTIGATSTPLNFDATYSFALGSNSIMGVGLTYDLSNAVLYKGFSSDEVIGDTTWKLKNHYSINFEPGYVVSDNALLYAKVAYHGGKSNVLTTNQTVTGYGYGFGVKYNLDQNLYVKIEAQQVKYNSYTIDSVNTIHKSTLGTIGLGYKF